MKRKEDDIGKVLKRVVRFLKTAELGIDSRPCYPAILNPEAGEHIVASVTSTTSLPVEVSSNRTDLSHTVDLLDGDSFVVESTCPVDFSHNPGTANVDIPVLSGWDTKVFMLQCYSTDPAGHTHRILIEAQAPALPPTPTLSNLTATLAGGGTLANGGSYPNSTPGLNAVTFSAIGTGAGSLIFHWNLQADTTAIPVTSTSDITEPIDLVPIGTSYPVTITLSVYVEDANHLFSPPLTISFTIT